MKIVSKYERWYNNIIEHRRLNPYNGYAERHHIIPRSFGGSDDYNNIVKLTAREHFICHKLLVKMTHGLEQQKMIHALWMMSTSKNRTIKITSIDYELLKIKISALMMGKHSQERIEINRKAQLIAQNRPETRERQRLTRSSKEFKEAQSIRSKNMMADPMVREKLAACKRKPVMQLTRDNVEVEKYSSAKEAQEATKINRGHICDVLKGRRSHAGGFIWAYID